MPTVEQSNLTAAQRSRNASIAALERWSREDPAANATRGQAGLRARFERQAREADPGISDAEAARRGECAYRAHMKRMAKNREAARAARTTGGSDAA
jgi:hypothetical protein